MRAYLPGLAVAILGVALSCTVQFVRSPEPPSDCTVEAGRVSAKCLCPDENDLTRLADEPALTVVRIHDLLDTSDLRLLARAPKLTGLQVEEVTRTHLDELGAVTQLRSLAISPDERANESVRLDALTGLVDLERFELHSCRGIVDLSPLARLPKLHEVEIRGECDVFGVDAFAREVQLRVPRPVPRVDGELQPICKVDPRECPMRERPCASRTGRIGYVTLD